MMASLMGGMFEETLRIESDYHSVRSMLGIND